MDKAKENIVQTIGELEFYRWCCTEMVEYQNETKSAFWNYYFSCKIMEDCQDDLISQKLAKERDFWQTNQNRINATYAEYTKCLEECGHHIMIDCGDYALCPICYKYFLKEQVPGAIMIHMNSVEWTAELLDQVSLKIVSLIECDSDLTLKEIARIVEADLRELPGILRREKHES